MYHMGDRQAWPRAYFFLTDSLFLDRRISTIDSGCGAVALRYFFDNFSLDMDRRELRRGTDVIAIAPKVFDLLGYLIDNRERVVSKDDLIRSIWQGRVVSDVALTTRLNSARKAIGD